MGDLSASFKTSWYCRAWPIIQKMILVIRWSDDINDQMIRWYWRSSGNREDNLGKPSHQEASYHCCRHRKGRSWWSWWQNVINNGNFEYPSMQWSMIILWLFISFQRWVRGFVSFLSINLFWRFLVTLRSMRCIWTTSPAPTLGRRKQGRCMQSSREDLTRLFQYYQRTVFAVFFWQVEKGIEERNAKLVEEGKIPYTVLLPRKIPTGIAVWFLEEFFRPYIGWWTNQHDLMHCPIISLPIWSDCCLLCRSKCEEIYCPLLSAPIIFLFDLNSHRLVTKILLTSSE